MKKLLQELSNSNKVKVAGSYATGKQTEFSDIDFQVKTPKECILYGERNKNMDFIKQLLKKYMVRWKSTRTGYITTIGVNNNISLQMEFYDCFHRNKNKLDSVTILGVNFKTY